MNFELHEVGMTFEEIEERIDGLITKSEDRLPSDLISVLRELVAAGESGVALENFCLELSDRNSYLASEELMELETVGAAMQIQPEYWQRLKSLRAE
jgi:hypothetical protein